MSIVDISEVPGFNIREIRTFGFGVRFLNVFIEVRKSKNKIYLVKLSRVLYFIQVIVIVILYAKKWGMKVIFLFNTG